MRLQTTTGFFSPPEQFWREIQALRDVIEQSSMGRTHEQRHHDVLTAFKGNLQLPISAIDRADARKNSDRNRYARDHHDRWYRAWSLSWSLDKTNAGQCGPSPSTHGFDLIYWICRKAGTLYKGSKAVEQMPEMLWSWSFRTRKLSKVQHQLPVTQCLMVKTKNWLLSMQSQDSQLADVPVIPCWRTRTAASMAHVMCALKRCRSCTTS